MRKRIVFALVPACALLGLAGCDKFIRGMGDDEPAVTEPAQAETPPAAEDGVHLR